MSPTHSTYAPAARFAGIEVSPSFAVTAWFSLLGLVLSFAAVHVFGVDAVTQALSALG